MYNAQFWANAWQDAGKDRLRPDPKLWQEYWDCMSRRYAEHSKANEAIHRNIINDLMTQGAIQAGDTLIDIGSGPGTYALPLAAHQVKVTGLDTSQGMLTTLSEHAHKAGLQDNISIRLADWHDIAPTATYDIAFAAKSPAINSYDSLIKMNKVARRACCLIGFAGKHDISLRRLLWEKLLGRPAPGPSFDIIYPLNILYQEGYRPHLSFVSYGQTQQEPLDYAIEHYNRYFAALGVAGPEVTSGIRTFLEDIATEGYCAETSETTIGIMWWRV